MRTEKSPWIRVDPMTVFTPDSKMLKGVTIMPSPYDLPDAVRAFLDEDQKTFVVEFKYASKEALERYDGPAGFSFRTGKKTGRLYRIEMDRELLDSHLAETASGAIQGLPRKTKSKSRARPVNDNYSAVQTLLKRLAPEWVGDQGLAPA